MSNPTPARIEVVHTGAGWHGRIVGSNGEPLWTTEVLEERESVVHAIQLLGVADTGEELVDVDERTADPGN